MEEDNENIEWQIPKEDEEEIDEEPEEVSKSESIENIVSQTPSSSPPIAHQLASPVLEARSAPQPQLETELQEAPAQETSQTESSQEQPYDSSSYMSDTYEAEQKDYPEIMQPANPILEQDFTRIQKTPRLTQTDTNLIAQAAERDWEKKYEGKFAEQRRDRRRI